MTEKENYMLMLKGEQPQWLPKFTFTTAPNGKPVPMCVVSPSVLHNMLGDKAGPTTDIWGVTYVPVPEVGGARIPEPDNFILHDINDWHDVIKAPNFDDIDWEKVAKHDLDKMGLNPNETAVIFDLNANYFQLLVSFMGFTEGLCAMLEEPEEVYALLSYINDFYQKYNRACFDYYKPDLVEVVDDTATENSPFISLELYRQLIKPFHSAQAKIGTDRGLGVDIHNCGKCESFIEDWRDFGVVSWNPAQGCNDLVGIKKKYGNSLILEGCWTPRGNLASPDVTEKEVKESVIEAIDTFAPGGGYMFSGGFIGPVGDPVTKQKNEWVNEVYENYGRDWYKNHK